MCPPPPPPHPPGPQGSWLWQGCLLVQLGHLDPTKWVTRDGDGDGNEDACPLRGTPSACLPTCVPHIDTLSSARPGTPVSEAGTHVCPDTPPRKKKATALVQVQLIGLFVK
mmetsp:Transcript_12477/g.22695  ORF Transcript_12477/g.22695 Transcript_12477/m.22695 type:complete len:111 (+) Transcript_12477:3-335(+)